MIKFLLVGDGVRDHHTVPHFVQNALNLRVEVVNRTWSRLHAVGGKGIEKKIRFATLQAIEERAHGLVVTVDADKAPDHERLKALREARAKVREKFETIPTVIAEACPHAEAWLLDDKVATGQTFQISPEEVPNYRDVRSPKDEIEKLKQAYGRRNDPIVDVLSDIAKRVDPKRCNHAKETGFEGLLKETRAEFNSILQSCLASCPCGDGCTGHTRAR